MKGRRFDERGAGGGEAAMEGDQRPQRFEVRFDFHQAGHDAVAALRDAVQDSRVVADGGVTLADRMVLELAEQRQLGLDYRRSLRNGYYWPFSKDVNIPDSQGGLIEIPTFVKMVPTWEMLTSKRVGLRQKSPIKVANLRTKLLRLRDFARTRYPMKLDFCRLTVSEMIAIMGREMAKDRKDPAVFRPIVAIGHTKDLVDRTTVDIVLSFLHKNQIRISTFDNIFSRLLPLNLKPQEKGTA